MSGRLREWRTCTTSAASRAAIQATVIAGLCAFFRLCGASFNIHRYCFTGCWMVRLFALVLGGGVLKAALWASPAIQ